MKPKVGFFEFTGCAGDLLTIVHSEDYLLEVLKAVEVVSFRLASSQGKREGDGLMDIVFIEGSITTTEQEEKLKELRKRSKILVALGTCATFGGVQAMYTGKPNFSKRFRSVYNKNFKIVEAFESKPLEYFVPVDYFLPGCPISPQLFLFNFPRLLKNLPVELPTYPVCVECKWQENECLLLKDIPCLGPVTRGGCLARCPKDNLPCVGCFGPVPGGNFASWEKNLLEKKYQESQLEKKMRFFFGAKIKEVKRGK
ncbi:MAG: cytochrome B [candidate division WOR-3 bacterium]